MTNLDKRIQALETRTQGVHTTSEYFSISAELEIDDPERLALFLAAMKRSGMLESPPASDDDSQLAEFVRAAEGCGLIQFAESSGGICSAHEH